MNYLSDTIITNTDQIEEDDWISVEFRFVNGQERYLQVPQSKDLMRLKFFNKTKEFQRLNKDYLSKCSQIDSQLLQIVNKHPEKSPLSNIVG